MRTPAVQESSKSIQRTDRRRLSNRDAYSENSGKSIGCKNWDPPAQYHGIPSIAAELFIKTSLQNLALLEFYFFKIWSSPLLQEKHLEHLAPIETCRFYPYRCEVEAAWQR